MGDDTAKISSKKRKTKEKGKHLTNSTTYYLLLHVILLLHLSEIKKGTVREDERPAKRAGLSSPCAMSTTTCNAICTYHVHFARLACDHMQM